jgi:hypothetical protein
MNPSRSKKTRGFDTNTASLTESDLLREDLFYCHDMAVTVGNRLYVTTRKRSSRKKGISGAPQK